MLKDAMPPIVLVSGILSNLMAIRFFFRDEPLIAGLGLFISYICLSHYFHSKKQRG